jgi:hypothetical protein
MADQDNENDRRMGFSIVNIPMLEEPSDWELWDRNSRTWILNNDVDVVRPLPAARGITWDRKQLKAVGQLLSRCGKRAYNIGAEEITVVSLKEILEPFYKEIEEGTFGEAFNEFNSLCLDECKDIPEYNTRFDNAYSKLCKFKDVTICRPLLVKKYLEGLGPGFDQWLSTFNQAHPLLTEGDVEGVTLKITMTAARVEEQKLTARTTSVAVLAKRNTPTQNTKDEPRGTKRQRGDKHCKIHLWGSHEDKDCIVQHPELETEWRKKYPSKAKARDEKKARRDATIAPASPPTSQTTQAKLAFVSISDNKF